MKIGIEAQRLFRKKKHGMDMVVLELIRNLQIIDKENEYFIFVKPDEDKNVIQETANFKIIELSGFSYPFWEQFVLPLAAKKYKCDILHCTSNTAPLLCSTPVILTLHDIIFMESSYMKLLMGDGSQYQKFGNIYRKFIVPRVIKKAIHVITVSDYENNRIREYFAFNETNRLKTVYNGASEHFNFKNANFNSDQIAKKYKLPELYFLFLGNTHPKKNTLGVLQAYSIYHKQTESPIPLVVIDYPRAELKKMIAEHGLKEIENDILLTDYVENTDLPAIYNRSTLFLYPSLRESFGIPIVEAMLSGTPAITSNTSSMPEIAGDAAILVDPFNSIEIASAITLLSQNKTLREKLIQKGIQQASKFSWKAMAENVLNLYSKTSIKEQASLNISLTSK